MAACLLLSALAPAQTIKIGAEAGYGSFVMQHIKLSVRDTGSHVYSSGVVFRLGPVVQLSFGSHVHLQSGISLVKTGFLVDRGYTDVTSRFYYLQVPLNLLFTSGKNKGFLSGLGASYGYAVGGTYDSTPVGGGQSEHGTLRLGTGSTDDYKRGNIGINTFMLGYRFGFGLYAYLAHSLGVSNMSAHKGGHLSGDEYFVTVGYLFK